MDTELYADHIAQHYAAYRPPLHEVILKRIIGERRYRQGLDIGCGTGQSSLALLPFCHQVVGIDPSREMLAETIKNECITYQYFDKEHLDFADGSFDIITLAGSLFYGKSQQLIDEIIRVMEPGGHAIVYDFNIHLETLSAILPIPEVSDYYDHSVNFSGLQLGNLTEITHQEVKESLRISTENQSHLLLSEQPTYLAIKALSPKQELYPLVLEKLNEMNPQQQIKLPVNLFWSLYEKQ